VVAIALGFIAKPTQTDLMTFTLAMVLMIVVGLIGALLHLNSNLVAQGTIIVERFIRGSPLLAPLLYANVGLLGLVTLLDPSEYQ
jgi:ABC-type amino acid transport system permease subunit